MNPVPAESSAQHSLSIRQRKSLTLDGVEDIISFDESGVVLRTTMGILNIEGGGLHITVLSLEEGRADIEGRIDGLLYTQPVEKQSGFRRLFG